MMATVIMALGILGLLALFAGTARQQQVSSEATRSLLITSNARAIMGSAVGRLDDAIDNAGLSTPGGPLASLNPDVWYPMTSIGNTLMTTALTPKVIGSAAPGALFFLTEAIEGAPFQIYSGSRDKYRSGQTTGFCDISSTAEQFENEKFEFFGRRLEPLSVRTILVQIVDVNPVTGEEIREIETRPYNLVFIGAPGGSFGNVAYYVGPDHLVSGFGLMGSFGLLNYPAPQCTNPLHDFIRIDLQSADTGGTDRAHIDNMQIRFFDPSLPATAGYRVKSVAIESPFQYRNSRLASLSDRLVYSTDASGGRVPSLGYSLLFRRNSSGQTQVMVATYAIRQTESGTQFQPQEDFSNVLGGGGNGTQSAGPLKRVQVTHGYDMAEERFYIEVSQQIDRWIVAPGTVVLMQGDLPGVGSTTPGSEISVTVVSSRIVNDRFRGYLNRAPRNGRRILLMNLTSPYGNAGAWAVQPSIVSGDASGSVWGLRSIAIEPVSLFDEN